MDMLREDSAAELEAWLDQQIRQGTLVGVVDGWGCGDASITSAAQQEGFAMASHFVTGDGDLSSAIAQPCHADDPMVNLQHAGSQPMQHTAATAAVQQQGEAAEPTVPQGLDAPQGRSVTPTSPAALPAQPALPGPVSSCSSPGFHLVPGAAGGATHKTSTAEHNTAAPFQFGGHTLLVTDPHGNPGAAGYGQRSAQRGRPQAAGLLAQPGHQQGAVQLSASARSHARRKQGMSHLESELAARLQQVQLLQQERAALTCRQHVLETMVGDADKLLQLVSQRSRGQQQQGADHLVALLTAGSSQPTGAPTAATRPLHVMLEEGAAANAATWDLEQAKQQWRVYVEQLQPLLQQVEAARAAPAGASSRQQAPLEATCRPGRRAAAAAAAGIIAAVVRQDSAPEAAAAQGATAGLQAQGAGGGPGVAPDSYSCCWPPAGEVGGQLVYGGPGTQGIPLQLLAQVEAVVLHHMSWLHALATSTSLDKYCFFADDFQGRGRAPPARHSPFWRRVVAAMRLTPAQLAECATSLEVATRCSHKVYAERAELTPALAPPVTLATPGPEYSLEAHMARMDIGLAAADHMQRNLTKEEVAMHLVGMYQSNVFSLLQQGQAALAAWPFFPGPWSVFEAAAQLHKEQQG